MVGFLLAAFTPLPNWLFARLAVAGAIGPADAIVVLGGAAAPDGTLQDSSLRRAVEGIRLRQRRLAAVLVFSGQPHEVAARVRLALDVGVPAGSIIAITGAQTTREEALAVRAHVSPTLRRILLVTDSQHLVRAKALFEHEGYEVLPAPANPLPVDTTDADERVGLLTWTLVEAAARAYYRLAGYL